MTGKAQSEISSLERTIATSAAQTIVESCGQPDPPGQNDWYNVADDTLEGVVKADVETAVRYLELRGLLHRDPSNPRRVCLADELVKTSQR
jgi:hypothetical protein